MARFKAGNTIGKDTRFKAGKQAAEKGQKGGVKSGESRAHAKTLREAMKVILEMKHPNGATGAENIIAALYEKAQTGDVQAVKLFAEMMEEYKKKVELDGGTQPFTMKVIEVSEDMQAKINEYLNG